MKPSLDAARLVRLMSRPALNGPRSLTRTITLRPFASLVTRRRVPKGYVLWAAVMALLENRSPLAVRFPFLRVV